MIFLDYHESNSSCSENMFRLNCRYMFILVVVLVPNLYIDHVTLRLVEISER